MTEWVRLAGSQWIICSNLLQASTCSIVGHLRGLQVNLSAPMDLQGLQGHCCLSMGCRGISAPAPPLPPSLCLQGCCSHRFSLCPSLGSSSAQEYISNFLNTGSVQEMVSFNQVISYWDSVLQNLCSKLLKMLAWNQQMLVVWNSKTIGKGSRFRFQIQEKF